MSSIKNGAWLIEALIGYLLEDRGRKRKNEESKKGKGAGKKTDSKEASK